MIEKYNFYDHLTSITFKIRFRIDVFLVKNLVKTSSSRQKRLQKNLLTAIPISILKLGQPDVYIITLQSALKWHQNNVLY